MTVSKILMNKEHIDQMFDNFNKLRIMIVGDVMMDSYIFGKVDRISPEAPVPIVVVRDRINRMGGAANVALNIHALGAEPILVSAVGNDTKGQEFLHLLEQNKMPNHGILVCDNRITTTKFRIIGNNVQMLRVDEEITDDINEDQELDLIKRVSQILENEQIDAIIFQDYDKGILTTKLIHDVIALANKKQIPIAVDPKKKNFLSYRNVQLFKPNLKELKEGLNLDFDINTFDAITDAVTILQQKLDSKIVLATLSEKGVFIQEKKENNTFINSRQKAHFRNIIDVSGAGDTVISVASLCLALNINADFIAIVSNLAGGLVCEEIGVVPVEKNKLHTELLRIVRNQT